MRWTLAARGTPVTTRRLIPDLAIDGRAGSFAEQRYGLSQGPERDLFHHSAGASLATSFA